MYNDLFRIGPVTIHTYGLMTAIGIIAAYCTAEYRAKKKGLDADKIFGLVISCVVLGYIGSKLLYLITILPQVIQDPKIILESLTGGWVVFGGILGGILGGFLYCRHEKLDTWSYFDTGLPSVALAQGIGRVGCFFAGCCYGVPTDAWYGITFRHSDYAPNGVSLVPTQLMSSAFDILLFFFLCYYDRWGKRNSGEVSALYLILYCVGRFFIEFLRGDLIRGSVGVLSTSQFISIFVLAAGICIFYRRRRKVSAAA